MADRQPLFRGAFPAGADDEFSGRGVRPVVFDIIAPDGETSILPNDLKLVLHVNPSSMSVKYQRVVERTQTKSGFVEQHFGDGTAGLDSLLRWLQREGATETRTDVVLRKIR